MALRRRRHEPGAQGSRQPYDPDWGVPPQFNFTRDVVDDLAHDPLRRSLVHVAADGTIDSCTARDLARESMRWSRLLHDRGGSPGARVVVALEPGTPWAAAILGAFRIGVLPVPVGGRLDATALAERIQQVAPELLVVDARSAPAAEGLAALLDRPPTTLVLEEVRSDLVRAGTPTVPADAPAHAPALIVFGQGRTSGRPRPVVHAHAAALAARVVTRDWLAAEAGDVVWCDAPGDAPAALWYGLLGPLLAGARALLVDDEIDADGRAAALERFAPTVAVGTPARYARLLELVEETGLRLPALRNAVCTGERLDPALVDRFAGLTGVRLLDGYGTAETGVVVFQPYGMDCPPGSVGVPAPGHIVAPIDEHGYVAPDGVIGDLAVHGRPPSLCLGYWTGELADLEPDADGDHWTLTGDRASFDQAGNLWLQDAATAALRLPDAGAEPLPEPAAETDALVARVG